jgi:hypothetical protein
MGIMKAPQAKGDIVNRGCLCQSPYRTKADSRQTVFRRLIRGQKKRAGQKARPRNRLDGQALIAYFTNGAGIG